MIVQWREEKEEGSCWYQGLVRESKGLIPRDNPPQPFPSKSSAQEFLCTLQRKPFTPGRLWVSRVLVVALFSSALTLFRNCRDRIGEWKGAFGRAVYTTLPFSVLRSGPLCSSHQFRARRVHPLSCTCGLLNRGATCRPLFYIFPKCVLGNFEQSS